MSYFVYILKNNKGKLYIGQTNNIGRRLEDHLQKEIKYTKDHKNFALVYSENYPSRIEAMRREKQLKGWTRAKKDALIAGDLGLLKQL